MSRLCLQRASSSSMVAVRCKNCGMKTETRERRGLGYSREGPVKGQRNAVDGGPLPYLPGHQPKAKHICQTKWAEEQHPYSGNIGVCRGACKGLIRKKQTSDKPMSVEKKRGAWGEKERSAGRWWTKGITRGDVSIGTAGKVRWV